MGKKLHCSTCPIISSTQKCTLLTVTRHAERDRQMLFKGVLFKGVLHCSTAPRWPADWKFLGADCQLGFQYHQIQQLVMVHYARCVSRRENTSSKKFSNVIDPAAALERFRSCYK